MDQLEEYPQDALMRELWTVDVDIVDSTPVTNVAFLGGPSETAFRILGAVGQAFIDHVVDGDHDLLVFEGNAVTVEAATAVLDEAFNDAAAGA
ncbi:MAG: hypothetical protein R2733_14105 [Acidimicrobiales bacterium]